MDNIFIKVTNDNDFEMIMLILEDVYNCIWKEGQKPTKWKPSYSLSNRHRLLIIENEVLRLEDINSYKDVYITVNQFLVKY